MKYKLLLALTLSTAIEGDVARGWRLYRAGEFSRAAEVFAARLAEAESDGDARTGLGYALLQGGRFEEARRELARVLSERPGDLDAERGLGMLVARGGGPEMRFRKDADAGAPVAVSVRALRDAFEIRDASGKWRPIHVKGINLGTARPGKFATEFPLDTAAYGDWLRTIADAGANAVRVYTLLPPAFYRALAEHNAGPEPERLHLVQGVWAELPPRHDFSDPGYVAGLHAEIARVVDAVHGDLATPPRPGHASGHYEVDASPWLLAFILGREWEPYAVKAFDAAHRGRSSFRGDWLVSEGASAMEAWVASLCDFAAGYEARRHGTLHPVSFANWPTLDPLTHPTESSRAEEDAWRRTYGIPHPEKLADDPWEDDAVSLDATGIAPTPRMTAGFFATYHVYPSYPDFLSLEGLSYEAYLRKLKRHHGSQPLLVAEFGISTSRGVAHVARSGWHHGGHDETRQGELLAAMIRGIRDAGCAGGILFELQDEWFKSTWSVGSLEVPAERRPLWWNAESPEESYGIIAHRPAAARAVSVLSGTAGAGWSGLRELRAAADAGYLHLTLRTAGGPPSPPLGRTVGYRIAIDTYDPARGETSLPAPGAATIATGAEFLVELFGPGRSAIRVTAPYEPYAAIEAGPIASPEGGAGRFVPLTFESNRERLGRDGRRFPAVRVDRGALADGTDVVVDPATGEIEVRLPWALLNVSDPSSRRVLHQAATHGPPFDTVATEGFRFYAFAFDPRDPAGAPSSALPERGPSPLFAWAGWELPAFTTERKAGFEAIRRAWSDRAR